MYVIYFFELQVSKSLFLSFKFQFHFHFLWCVTNSIQIHTHELIKSQFFSSEFCTTLCLSIVLHLVLLFSISCLSPKNVYFCHQVLILICFKPVFLSVTIDLQCMFCPYTGTQWERKLFSYQNSSKYLLLFEMTWGWVNIIFEWSNH